MNLENIYATGLNLVNTALGGLTRLINLFFVNPVYAIMMLLLLRFATSGGKLNLGKMFKVDTK